MLYFASGVLGLAGAMFTASHNPARYNGIKLCRATAVAIGQDSGLAAIRAAVEEACPTAAWRAAITGAICSPTTPRTCAAWSTVSDIRTLKVVVDAGNGMGGYTVPAVLGDSELPPCR